MGINIGNSSAVTIEIVNKRCREILKYIDEELLERVKRGASRGLFRTSIIYMGAKPSDADRLKSGIISLFQGGGSTYSTFRAYGVDVERNPQLLTNYQNFYVGGQKVLPEQLALLSRPQLGERMGLNTYLTTREISLTAGLPQREVPGIVVKVGVEFGLNFERSENAIELGKLIQKGRILHDNSAALDGEVLNKHIFIAGVTGSGKTTTCHKLLREARRPFLVLEPAKTEYREFINHFDDVAVFTVGDESTAPLRLNPFELVSGENLSAHIDMLKATFVSSFPMEASMPQLIEEAIYKIYEDKGWSIDGDRFDDEKLRADQFPTLDDFLRALEKIVDTKGFSDRLRDDYRGSLVSRFSNLTKGSKGALLNCQRSINFDRLLDRNVIIEMENLKSAEDKALVMGFILTRLAAAIKNRHGRDKNYRHITLIEEAHRLLSKVEFGDSGTKRTAVETFTDMLAEIRKYGESLIVVDQIPNKLAPEVLK